jgi:hypothetical protein
MAIISSMLGKFRNSIILFKERQIFLECLGEISARCCAAKILISLAGMIFSYVDNVQVNDWT